MPNWKKVVVSGSAANLSSLHVDNSITASIFSGSQFIGNLFGTASQAISSSYAATASSAVNFFISGGITSVDYIQFNTSSVSTRVEGKMYWNSTDRTLDLGTGNAATLQLGQELYYPPVVNKTTASLAEGTLVMVNPTQIAFGNRLNVIPAIANGTYPSDLLVGILTEDIAVNQQGFATWFGYVRALNLSNTQPAGETWAEGNILYANPTLPGKLTNVEPTAPNLKASIAAITAINGNTVTLLVRPNLIPDIKSLNNVKDLTTTSSYGDLFVTSGSIWINSRQLTGSYGLTGSLTAISGGFTGSLFGNASTATTASYANFALTASYALNAAGGGGGATTGSNTFYGDQTISGSLTVTGSASANIFLYPQTASNVVIPSGHNGLLLTPVQLQGTSSVDIGARLVIL